MLQSVKQAIDSPRTFIYNAGVESVLEYNNPEKVVRKRHRPKLVISPFIPSIDVGAIDIFGEDLGGLLKSWEFTKDRSNPGGILTIGLSADDRSIERFLKSQGLYSFYGPIWDTFGSSITDIFKPRALVQFWLDDYHICTGFVNNIVKNTDHKSRGYTVVIDELGSIYNETIMSKTLYLNIQNLHLIDASWKILELSGPTPGIPMWLALFKMFTAFQASTLLYGSKGFPLPLMLGSDSLPMAFRLITAPAPIGAVSNNSIISQISQVYSYVMDKGGTPFWSHVKSLCPESHMELFCETGGRTICAGRLGGAISGGAAIGLGGTILSSILNPVAKAGVTPMLPGFCYTVARSVPYDNPLMGPNWAWPLAFPFLLGPFDLLLAGDFIIITDRDIKSKNIGSSGADQFTSFAADILSAEGSGKGDGFKPAVSGGPLLPIFPGGIRTFGVRHMEEVFAQTSFKFAGLFGEITETMFTRLGLPGFQFGRPVLTDCLAHWHRNKFHFREGTFVTRPIPYARPGMCLLYWPDLSSGRIDDPREMGIYYIDNVKTEGTAEAGGSTTLGVIRGTPFPANFETIMEYLFEWDLGIDLPSILDGVGK